MRKRLAWQCEILEENPASAVKRYKVIGGWHMVHQTYYDLGTQKARLCESSVFVPDPHHEWEILPPPKPELPTQKQLATDFQSPESKF